MTPVGIKTLFFTLVVLAAVCEATGDILLKKWSLEHSNWILVIGLGIYFCATVVWAFALKYEFLSKAISIVTVVNLMVVILVGVLYFKEDLSVMNKIGIALGIASIYFTQA